MPGFVSLPLRVALVAGLVLVAGASGALAQFDGHPFTATGNGPLSGANYTLAVAQGGTGTINDASYGANAAEIGGNRSVQAGPTYLASGDLRRQALGHVPEKWMPPFRREHASDQ